MVKVIPMSPMSRSVAKVSDVPIIFFESWIDFTKNWRQISTGNNDAHIILRGGKVPNFDKESVEQTLTALKEAEVNESIMIDASHGNSQKKFKQQIPVIESICQQITEGNNNIKGVMIESHLNEGNQKITEKLNYGQSITDACMGWEDTVMCLQKLNDTIKLKRGK